MHIAPYRSISFKNQNLMEVFVNTLAFISLLSDYIHDICTPRL